uniref:Ribonuclease P protein subunit p38 n=1 Tax=Geotrypetes seraphini TaxID=260995 RepID=A0A6P8QI64_GEOSA|nr:ribonuclease P protein subunit p38 [Geotrypetes seraphini]
MTSPAQIAKGSIRKAKPLAVKTSLNSPFSVKWSALQGDDMHFIVQTLREKFTETGLKKIETPNRRKSCKIAKRKNRDRQCSKGTKKLAGDKEVQEAESKEASSERTEVKQGWTSVLLRKELALGVNEVTRALEKNDLNLVLVCKSVKPALITMHLIELSVSRAIPACQVPRLSENIAPLLGLKSVLALGFRRSTNTFDAEVRAITARVPLLYVPWLQCTFEHNLTAAEQDRPQEVQETEAMEMSTSKTPRNLKRKHEPGYLDSDAKVAASSLTLQTLKIKKLVPNPNKVRKVKKKKLTSK